MNDTREGVVGGAASNVDAETEVYVSCARSHADIRSLAGRGLQRLPHSARKVSRIVVNALPLLAFGASVLVGTATAYGSDVLVTPDWDKSIGRSKTVVSIQVCPEPPMRRGSPVHDQLFTALRNLKADYARFQPWRMYPRLAVAELEPPTAQQTFWDFSLIDPLVEDFMSASEGRPVIFTFGTIPSWMLITDQPDAIPANPDEISSTYGLNPHFRHFDRTIRLFAAYEARLAGWYMKGGFYDETHTWHASPYHFRNIAYWGVLNEPGAEHVLTPEQYTKVYDAVVAAVKAVAPTMKFVGLADESVWVSRFPPDLYPYFLNLAHHRQGTSLDAISYHLYVMPDSDERPPILGHVLFKEADRLLTAASFIDVIRRNLSPQTKTIVEELGTVLPWDSPEQLRHEPIDPSYWNLSGATWAYEYGHLVRLGVNMVHGAELIDYPGQAASLSLTDWTTGLPNARYWVLKLLRDSFAPGDRIVPAREEADPDPQSPAFKVYWQAFETPGGARKILLVNMRNETVSIRVTGGSGGALDLVDQNTTFGPARRVVTSDSIALGGFAVGVLTLSDDDRRTQVAPTRH